MSVGMPGQDRTGTSLVEVLIATFLLTIIALGTTAYVYQAAARIGYERNRRVALEVAIGRLEALRAAPYAAIKPQTQDFSNNVTTETVTINGHDYRIVTRIRYMDVEKVLKKVLDPLYDDKGPSYDCVRAIVRVRYRPGSNEQIELATYIAP